MLGTQARIAMETIFHAFRHRDDDHRHERLIYICIWMLCYVQQIYPQKSNSLTVYHTTFLHQQIRSFSLPAICAHIAFLVKFNVAHNSNPSDLSLLYPGYPSSWVIDITPTVRISSCVRAFAHFSSTISAESTTDPAKSTCV